MLNSQFLGQELYQKVFVEAVLFKADLLFSLGFLPLAQSIPPQCLSFGMNAACKVCGTPGPHTSHQAREMMYGLRHTFTYLECSACGCLQIETFPEDMSAYYPGDYYSFQAPDTSKYSGFKWNVKLQRYRSTLFRNGFGQRLLHQLMPGERYASYFPHVPHTAARILDVGCGNGLSILFPLAELGFTHLLGIDPYLPQDIDYPNGLPVRRLHVQDVEGEWDFITYHHSFEHVPDPLLHLQSVSRLLAPGGVCLIRIPTASSFAWRHYGINWAQLDAPRHFFLHTQASLAHLAQAAGLEIFKVQYDATHFQFSGSEKLVRDIALRDPLPKGFSNWARRKLNKRRYTRRARRLNRAMEGDQACFYLRRG